MAKHAPSHAVHPDARHDGGHEDHHSALPYVAAWLALIALTGITYWSSRHDLGSYALLVALAIATIKTLVVILIFMHLREHRGAVRLAFAISSIFVAILVCGVLADLSTRFPLARPHDSSTPPPRPAEREAPIP